MAAMSARKAELVEQTNLCTEPSLKSVPVLYYLSRNGHLQHPHFMEVPLSSPNALFLSDVINRLNVLRGKGTASMYSWSCKRSYKNGFVWHDLSENDFIYPAHAHEYILKGSELPENPSPVPASPPRRRNHSLDFNETSNRRSEGDEIQMSPPPSDSSPETLETLMKATGAEVPINRSQQIQKCRRRTSVLMQLISCGAMSLKGCGAGPGLGLIGLRLPRGGGKEKEYFSGSLVETKKEEFPGLKRSTSYNGDRKLYLEVNSEKEIGERFKVESKMQTNKS